MFLDSLRYATQNLAHRRLRSWLTIIGIFIGIAAVVALISLGQGMQQAIASQFAALGADTLAVQPRGGGFGPPGIGSAVELTRDDLEVVQDANYVQGAAARVIRIGTIEADGQEFGFIASIPERRDERDIVEDVLQPELEDGRWIRADDSRKVVLGYDVAHDSSFDQPVAVGDRILVENVTFDVVGVHVKKGSPQYDMAIMMNEEDARDILDLPDQYNAILAKATSPDDVEFAREAIMKDLRQHRGVEERREDFTIQTSEEILATFNDVLSIVTGVLVGIAAISLLVGGIGIMNTMYTAVVQRTKEIGIMKAVGATNGQVMQIFLLESGLLGLVGGLIGVIIGAGLSWSVEAVATLQFGPGFLQASTPLWLVLGALGFSFVVGTLSGTLPAKNAADLPPVEALR